jgi:16S rRNA (guanine966-N2)-methyltransferase
MRIIGGNKKGKRILVARKGVRPTKAIVREAIIQVIHDRIPGARILDIFAGSGALGLEALSRGAYSCVFVEHHPAILYRNIENIAPDKETIVICTDYTAALKRIKDKRFTIIFLDPPYSKKYVGKTVALIAAYSLLEPHGIAVIEHPPEQRFPLPDSFAVFKQKRYGDTAITYIAPKEIHE